VDRKRTQKRKNSLRRLGPDEKRGISFLKDGIKFLEKFLTLCISLCSAIMMSEFTNS